MVDRQKTIGETIDTDGCFQTIHSMAMVCMNYENLLNFTLKWPVFANMGLHWVEIIPKM